METRKKNLFRLFCAAAVVAMLSVQCGTEATPTGAPTPTEAPASTEAPAPTEEAVPPPAMEGLAEEQILRFGSQEEDAPRGFDPTISTSTPSMDIQKEIYNALVRLKLDASSYEDIEPDLATHWEASPDQLIWTFYLRQGVQFQKGFGELTAEDVVFTLDRARAEGASWATSFQNIDSVEALDKYTVRITLSAPDPYFLYKMSNAGNVAAVIVSKKAVEQYGEDFAFNPIGTGPFQFEQYLPKQKVVLAPFEDYFRGRPILDRLEYLFVPEIQAQVAAMKAGELDIMRGEQDPQWVDDVQAAGLRVLSGVPFALPLAFNLTKEPFDDIRVRQAVKHAIDPVAFVEYYGEEFVLPDQEPYSPWPWHMRVYQAAKGKVKTYEYDPEKAKQLLAAAGYPDGFSLDLTWTNQARFRVPMEILQAQLTKVGIQINLNIVEHAVYREAIDEQGQALAMISISRDTPDAVAREWFHSDSIPPYGATAKYNYAHYGEALPGVDDLIEQAIAEMDPDKAVELYVEIQQHVAEDLPIICLFQGMSEPFVTSPYLDLGYEFRAPDRRYPIIMEKTRIMAEPLPPKVAVATAPPAPTEAPVPPVAQEDLAEEQILRFGTEADDAPVGFDPTLSKATPSMDIQKVIYNALVRLEPGAESYEDVGPDLAERWESSSDGLIWTFYLRKGVQFQKGYGEMTAEDVVFSLDRARAEGAGWASLFKNIESVEAVDDYTVKVTAKDPDPYFLFKLSNAGNVAAVIVSKKAVEEFGEDFAFNPIGTGPFQLEQYLPKQRVVLVRNENYFRGQPIIERLEYVFVPDLQTRTAALYAGELDVMQAARDPEWFPPVLDAGYKVLEGVPYSLPLALNLTVEPFDDIRVRQAIIYALDRTAFADYYGEEFVITDPVVYSIWPYNLRAYKAAKDVVKTYEYDPDKAKQLLAEAGYPDGFSVDLTWTTQERFRVPMEIVQAQLAKVGIELNLNIVEHAAYRDVIDGSEQAIAMISIRRETPDSVALEWFHTDAIPGHSAAKYNYAHYGEAIPGVDDLIEQAVAEMDPDKAVELYVEIQKRVSEDLPVIPLLTGTYEPYVRAPYVDMGYEWHAVDRRFPPITEKTKILKH